MEGIEELHELDEYLLQPIERVRDPVGWWWDHRLVYPKLSKMAFDYLSVPGTVLTVFRGFSTHLIYDHLATSTAVERVFSQGRHLLHFTRNRLSPASIRAIMCLGDWSRRNLVSNKDVVDAIVNNRKRKRVASISVEED